MVKIELQNVALDYITPDQGLFETWAQAIQVDAEITPIVALRIVDESEMTHLNSHYRQKQGPTNVLSFPADLPEQVDIPFIGDVVICAPVVIQEALKQGKSEQSHWAHMVVHGILHLLGYDHESDAAAKQMELLEINTLQQLGFNNPYS